MNSNRVSAVFDDRDDARRAMSELHEAGFSDDAISLLGRPDDHEEGMTRDHDEGGSKGSVIGATAAGGVAGALLGVAALAIPGVGPLAAAGAIAASAVPTAGGIGAAVGATGGAIARMLGDHDVDREDAEYYEHQIERGGIFVSVDTGGDPQRAEVARDILHRYGGHSASHANTATAAD